jgi:hypothetical protein
MTDTLTVAQTIESISALDRKEVTIRGFLSLQREDHSIADDASEENRQRRLWVVFHHGSLGTREKQLVEFHGKEVVVTGILDRQKKGHFSLFPAAFTIRGMRFAEKTEPIQPPQTTTGSSAPDRV